MPKLIAFHQSFDSISHVIEKYNPNIGLCPNAREAWRKVSTISRFWFVTLFGGLGHFWHLKTFHLSSVFCSPGQQICSQLVFGWSLLPSFGSCWPSPSVLKSLLCLLLLLHAFLLCFCSLLQFFVVQVNRYVVNWCLGEVFYLPLGPVDHLQVFWSPCLVYLAACLTVMFCSLPQFFVVQVNRYVVNWCLGEVFYLPLGPVDHLQVFWSPCFVYFCCCMPYCYVL